MNGFQGKKALHIRLQQPSLSGTPLVSQTPPFSAHPSPPLADAPPGAVAIHAQAPEFSVALGDVHAKLACGQLVALYAVFACISSLLGQLGRTDDLRYAAHTALRLTAEELDEEMERSVLGGHASSLETFKPLVSCRLTCKAALKPLIDFESPPAEVFSG